MLTILVSCNPIDGDWDSRYLQPRPCDSIVSVKSLNVSVNDVKHYINISDLIKTKSSEPEIEPITYNNDTALYIVNFNDGWKIISADKRAPIVLAYSDEGRFDLNNNPSQLVWLDQTVRDLLNLKQNGDENTNPEYVQVWDTFSANPTPLFDSKAQDGYWNLIKATRLPNHEAVRPRLTKTLWDQRSLWNECVPFAQGSSQRCLAGCVAIAGAQMFYYLHGKLGVPQQMYTAGYCIGDQNNHTFSFEGLSTSAWNAIYRAHI